MKMKKLLSIGALTLTLMTCTSVSAFAAESVGNQKDAAIKIAQKAANGGKVVNNVNISINTHVKDYAKPELVNKITTTAAVVAGVQYDVKEDATLYSIIRDLEDYNAKPGQDITTDETFKASKEALSNMVSKLKEADKEGKLGDAIKYYLNTDKYGDLTVGKNSNKETVVSLKKKNSNVILLQISSEDIDKLDKVLKNDNINSWTQVKNYLEQNKIKYDFTTKSK